MLAELNKPGNTGLLFIYTQVTSRYYIRKEQSKPNESITLVQGHHDNEYAGENTT